jgi:hypothetical protein
MTESHHCLKKRYANEHSARNKLHEDRTAGVSVPAMPRLAFDLARFRALTLPVLNTFKRPGVNPMRNPRETNHA